jgi:hypothetical protein
MRRVHCALARFARITGARWDRPHDRRSDSDYLDFQTGLAWAKAVLRAQRRNKFHRDGELQRLAITPKGLGTTYRAGLGDRTP